MDIDVCKTPNHPECIRCGLASRLVPKDAIQYLVSREKLYDPKKDQTAINITNVTI